MGAQYGVFIRPSVAMPVMFVLLSHNSFHVKMHPVPFVGVLVWTWPLCRIDMSHKDSRSSSLAYLREFHC